VLKFSDRDVPDAGHRADMVVDRRSRSMVRNCDRSLGPPGSSNLISGAVETCVTAVRSVTMRHNDRPVGPKDAKNRTQRLTCWTMG
jgi:hypothetical protein